MSCKIQRIIETLRKLYPNVQTALAFSDPFELLVATILSAQTTDIQVNKVTPELFANYPDAQSLSLAEAADLEVLIKSIGLYKTKAKHLIQMARILVEKYNGQIPACRESLIELPGVGRKTANVVVSSAFDIPAIAVDTHVFRVSKRLGLSSGKDVLAVEKELMSVFARKDWNQAHHWLIWHGRLICKAKHPDCLKCQLRQDCDYHKLQKS